MPNCYSRELIVINLQKLTCTDKPTFDEYFGSRYCENAEYTFTNLFMWRDMMNLQWAVEDDVLYMFSTNEEIFSAWQPIGAADKMQDAITKILRTAEENRGDRKFMFVVVEKIFADELARYPHAKFDITPERDNFDYVYLAQDLINLSGRKFHGKKNHLNAFARSSTSGLKRTNATIPTTRLSATSKQRFTKFLTTSTPSS